MKLKTLTEMISYCMQVFFVESMCATILPLLANRISSRRFTSCPFSFTYMNSFRYILFLFVCIYFHILNVKGKPCVEIEQ